MNIESLVKSCGVNDLKVIDAFDIKALREGLKDSLDRPEVSAIIVRGNCAVKVKKRANPRAVDTDKCTQCGTCLRLGCSAIQTKDGRVFIDPTLCAGDICTICEQLCPQKAISGPVKSKE